MLKSSIVDHGITPTYRFLGKSSSGPELIFNYSCTLFGMYGLYASIVIGPWKKWLNLLISYVLVEGNGTSKYKAKENAATEMLRSILKKQKNRTLSSHIRAFNEKE